MTGAERGWCEGGDAAAQCLELRAHRRTSCRASSCGLAATCMRVIKLPSTAGSNATVEQSLAQPHACMNARAEQKTIRMSHIHTKMVTRHHHHLKSFLAACASSASRGALDGQQSSAAHPLKKLPSTPAPAENCDISHDNTLQLAAGVGCFACCCMPAWMLHQSPQRSARQPHRQTRPHKLAMPPPTHTHTHPPTHKLAMHALSSFSAAMWRNAAPGAGSPCNSMRGGEAAQGGAQQAVRAREAEARRAEGITHTHMRARSQGAQLLPHHAPPRSRGAAMRGTPDTLCCSKLPATMQCGTHQRGPPLASNPEKHKGKRGQLAAHHGSGDRRCCGADVPCSACNRSAHHHHAGPPP